MEQTVTERPFSQEQQINQPPTWNNGTVGSNHIRFQQDPSQSGYPRRWTGLNQTYAPDGSCNGGNHRQDRGQRPSCRDFLRGKCDRGASCKFRHSESDKHEGLLHGNDQPNLGAFANLGNSQFKGAYKGNDLRTRSFSREHRSRSPCRNFQSGRCFHGASCRYLHPEFTKYDRPMYDRSTQQHQGFATTSRNPGFGEGNIDNTLTSQEHDEANKGNDLRTRSFGGEYSRWSPCRKFLKGMCPNGSACRYLHHEYTTSKNPGFGEGSRVVTLRTSQERDEAIRDNDLRSRSFSRDYRSRSPCRNFIHGRCYNGASCAHLHPDTIYDRPRYHGSRQQHQTPSRNPVFGEENMNVTLRTSQENGEVKSHGGQLCQDNHAGSNFSVNYNKENMDVTSGRWSSERQRSRPAGEFGGDKLRVEVCLRFSKGRCNDGESCRYLHGGFHEYARSISGKPTNLVKKDEARGMDEHKREIPGEPSAKNGNLAEGNEVISLWSPPFKRRRRSRSPITREDNFGYGNIRRHESQISFHRGRGYNVASFRYPYSRSYNYEGPRNHVNNRQHPKVDEDSNLMVPKEHEVSPGMQLAQCPAGCLNAQPRHVDQAGQELVAEDLEIETSKGEDVNNRKVVESHSISSSEKHYISPVDTHMTLLNKEDNDEVNINLSEAENEETDEVNQAVKTSLRKRKRKVNSSSSKCSVETMKEELTDPSTQGISDDMKSAAKNSSVENVLTTDYQVQQIEQENGVIINNVQNNMESTVATVEDGTLLVGNTCPHFIQTSQSSSESAIPNSGRKLIVLDVNGLLADIVNVADVPGRYKPDAIISLKAVFKRPFCDDFLQFCFERFDVGVWSSRTKKNVDRVVDFLLGDTKKRLLFCWDQYHCTETGYKTIENKDKPLVLKELKKLWDKQDSDLPWEKGVYNQTNTVLLDDSPYKALRNPPHTAIFPHPYMFRDIEDKSLGPGGDLRMYLERLSEVEDVQKFIQENPFGQRPITKSNLSWTFYAKIISNCESQEANANSTPCN